MGQQHRGGRQAVLVQDPAELAHRPLAGVDDDGVRPGPLCQHVAVAGQHAGRKSGDQHDDQFPIPARSGRASWPALSILLAHSLRIDELTRRTTAVPTNEQRRATAKRKLERQLERRAAQARRRRLYTIIGSVVGVVAVVAAVVAFVSSPNATPTARPRRPPRPRRAARPAPTEPRPWPTASCRVQGARRPRRQLPIPGGPTGQQAEQAAADRQGAHRPGAGQRQHVDRPGQHRPAARQRQGAVHRQQLRQPGPAGLLQRHPLPPADHQRGPCGAAVRRPDRSRQRWPGLRVRQRVPDRPVPARRPRSSRIR